MSTVKVAVVSAIVSDAIVSAIVIFMVSVFDKSTFGAKSALRSTFVKVAQKSATVEVAMTSAIIKGAFVKVGILFFLYFLVIKVCLERGDDFNSCWSVH